MLLTRTGKAWAWTKVVLAVLVSAATTFAMTYTGLVIWAGVVEVMIVSLMGAAAWFAIFPKGLEDKFFYFTRNAQRIGSLLLAMAVGFGVFTVTVIFYL